MLPKDKSRQLYEAKGSDESGETMTPNGEAPSVVGDSHMHMEIGTTTDARYAGNKN
jgi:hypothetical protein